jgi:FkbH-like protein
VIKRRTLLEIENETKKLIQSGETFDRKNLCIISSINIGMIGKYLTNIAANSSVLLDIQNGTYNNPIQDAENMAKSYDPDFAVLIPFFDNLLPSLESRCVSMTESEIGELLRDFARCWKLTVEALPRKCQIVILGLHPLYRGYPMVFNRRDEIIDRFNKVLLEISDEDSRIKVVDSKALLASIGFAQGLDLRMYYRAKSPFKNMYLEDLSITIAKCFNYFGDSVLKVLALDFDNTLWGGILGEDGIEGVHINPFDSPGSIFYEIQHRLKDLKRMGILLVALSKNNEADALEMLSQNPHNVLQPKDFISMRINWNDKTDNLKELAAELSISLESFAVLDDSPYECEEIHLRLPQVRIFQVPELLEYYPALVDEVREIYLRGRNEDGDDKTFQYELRKQGLDDQKTFLTHSEYLDSLGIVINFNIDNEDHLQRATEMTLKTNQFNLTTIRRSESEIRKLIEDPRKAILTFEVSDKYGTHGVVGLSILEFELKSCLITDFMISCRVLGKDVEYAMLEVCAQEAIRRGCDNLVGIYRSSKKNAQTSDFYRLEQTSIVESQDGSIQYVSNLSNWKSIRPDWIRAENND